MVGHVVNAHRPGGCSIFTDDDEHCIAGAGVP